MIDSGYASRLAMRAQVLYLQGRAEEAIVVLAEAFPPLEGAAGLRPWRPDALHRWAVDVRAGAAQDCARFILSVWNIDAISILDRRSEEPLGEFDVFCAAGRWDLGSRVAFSTWMGDPWRAQASVTVETGFSVLEAANGTRVPSGVKRRGAREEA